MKFSTAIAILTSACLTSASPVLQKRDFGGLTMCTGANKTGDCQHLVVPEMGTCYNTTGCIAESPTVLTFLPDVGVFFCRPFADPACGAYSNCTSPHGCFPGDVTSETGWANNLANVSMTVVKSYECLPGKPQYGDK